MKDLRKLRSKIISNIESQKRKKELKSSGNHWFRERFLHPGGLTDNHFGR